jgi:hypothetical protein
MDSFKLIVAGGRDFTDYQKLQFVLLSLGDYALADKEVSIVSGMAPGADRLGALFAEEYHVPLHKFPAQWETYGKRAGFIRNSEMAKASDGLVAFWDKKSRGTAHMIKTMESQGKFVHVVNY